MKVGDIEEEEEEEPPKKRKGRGAERRRQKEEGRSEGKSPPLSFLSPIPPLSPFLPPTWKNSKLPKAEEEEEEEEEREAPGRTEVEGGGGDPRENWGPFPNLALMSVEGRGGPSSSS